MRAGTAQEGPYSRCPQRMRRVELVTWESIAREVVTYRHPVMADISVTDRNWPLPPARANKVGESSLTFQDFSLFSHFSLFKTGRWAGDCQLAPMLHVLKISCYNNSCSCYLENVDL